MIYEQLKYHDSIAVIGLACRFPKADNYSQFWENIINGKECIETFSVAGDIPETLNGYRSGKFINRGGRINNPQYFDESFFGYTPREASFTDPQHRIFLETGWEALESAGYDAKSINCKVGVFAGCGMNHYLTNNIIRNEKITSDTNEIQLILGNDKDFLTTRLSYKLNLNGPSFDIQTACSSSLVSVHTANTFLLTNQCDIALAGGVFLQIPWWNGYNLTEGDIRSTDGKCRPFDADANGTVFGEGAGIIVLKRLQDALRDRDHIYALIRGSAINNDGSFKAGYTAPGIKGQKEVVVSALQSAGVNASDITYVEAHGTGTPVGDPIEISALSAAFREFTQEKRYCALGSVKSSIGHLDAAAGVAGIIKTILSLYYKKIPPLVNFTKPNPLINFSESPFYIPTNLQDWQIHQNSKRLAGVSSLGVGGTNAHVILEEAPVFSSSDSSRTYHFIPLSARTETSLKTMIPKYSQFFSTSSLNVADCAYTLQTGRHQFPLRHYVVQSSSSGISDALNKEFIADKFTLKNKKTVFMFTGQGSLYPNCCKDLYSESIVFREAFDTCADILNNLTSVDFKGLLFNGVESDNNELIQTRIAQPMLFALEYSLSKLWESAGITPSAMIGHSIGEYVAATISGVFSLEDALYLVSKRGTFMQLQPAGAMISVNYPIGKLYQLLPQSVQIATINTPELAVVSGPHTSINEFCSNLSSLNISFRNVNTSHAFHSEMMEGAVAPFISILKSINLGIPKIPYISNVTGNWVNDKDLSDFQYWATHLRNTVNFSEGIHRLLEDQYYTFIEIGPGNTLCSFVKRCHTYYVKHEMFDKECSITSVSSVRSEHQTDNDYAFYLKALGSLWMRGFDIDMNCFYKGEKRYRVPMPTYSFDRKYHWIEPTQKINTGIGLPLLNVPVTSIHSDANESSEHKQQNHKPEAQNSIENTVHKIWVDLLGLDHIGSEQNFYEIGGDSIWASQIISRINDAFAISIPLSAFLKTPTISGLTTEIQQRLKESSQAVKHSGISITDNNSPVPLTVSQQRLWFLNLLTPESPANNLSTQFSIKGRFDIKAAHDAIKHIVRKHDSLRMVIEETSSNPVLIVKESVIFDFDVVDISHEVNKISRLKQEVLSRSLKPYDLTKGPLLRILLVSLDPYNHFLYVMTHHIISDGWSMGIFLKDFAYFYKLIITNSPIPNQTVEMTFSEYAKLVANQNHSDSVEHIQYWTRTLSLPLPVTELPSDNIRPPHRSFKGGGTSFSIDSQICTNLEIYAKKEHVTIFVLFLTAYYILLSKYSGQKDIIIGTPVANRNNLKFEKIFGFFLNMLPLRINPDKIDSFSELLHHVNDIVTGAFEYQELPFSTIIEHVKPQRNLNQNPIFQIMFAFQNFPLEKAVIDDTVISASVSDRGTTEYDFSLYMWPDSDKYSGIIEYDSDIFNSSTINRMISHFNNILNQISTSHLVQLAVSDISVLSPEESDVIINHWNNTEMSFDSNAGIHDLFKDIVKRYPDKRAVVFNSTALTYSELDNKADIIASILSEKSVKPGDLVGICMERSSLMIAALLGILKSGAAYVPLDPHYPSERLSYMINDARLKYIVAQTDTISMFSKMNEMVSFINTDLLPQNCTSSVHSSTFKTAYVIYTSGSTGKPKGVRISHQSVVNLLKGLRKKPGLDPTDVVLATTTLSFDISVLEIFLPLITGACCVMVDHETSRDGAGLITTIEQHSATLMQGTPGLWRLLLSCEWSGSKQLKALCGGEKLPPDLISDLLPKVKELWNMYGPTETTVWSTCHHITDSSSPVLIGRPIANTQIYILDTSMKPVAPGVTGELYIGGAGLAEGYHNLPDMTASRFIQSPFSKGLIYKTGDLARFCQDGLIEYIGRSDTQVKIRGFRIELDEIEKICLGFTGIKHCTAACKSYSSSDTRLILYYIVKTNNIVSSANLREYLRKYLPDYMIPQHFIELENFPLTPSGKVDKSALPLPEDSNSTQKDHPELFTPDEAYLAQIWKKVLGQKVVRASDNFFEIGGHSLLSMSVIAQIRKETGLTVSPQSLLLQTLEQIAMSYNFSKYIKNKPVPKRGLFSIQKKLSSYFTKKQVEKERY